MLNEPMPGFNIPYDAPEPNVLDRVGIHDCKEQRCPKHCCTKLGCPHVKHCTAIGKCQQTNLSLADPCVRKDRIMNPATDALDKPDLIRDALQEFPYAQYAIANLVKDAANSGHPARSWRSRGYAAGNGTYEGHLAYFTGKAGRHLACREIDGEVNKAEGNQLHMVAAAWALMAYVDTMLRELAEHNGDMKPHDLLDAIKDGSIELC